MSARIAIDAMGGDYAPSELVKGALSALKSDPSLSLILVGDEGLLRAELALNGASELAIEIVHASETIGMDEAAAAVRRKKDASINVAMGLVKRGEAQAVVALGSTGAAMSAALLSLGRIKGIERPAIGVVIPTLQGPCLLIDVGANADCKPLYLQQFAIMGQVYARQVLKVANPRVGLLNIGEESSKGNELALASYALLAETPRLGFVGNIEGRDMTRGKADVVVTDGFVGNIVLKSAEGFAELFETLLRQSIMAGGLKAKLGAWLMRQALKSFKRRVDPAEYGGALLLGVNGVCIIGHGSSRAYAVSNAIRLAKEAIVGASVARIAEHLAPSEGTPSTT